MHITIDMIFFGSFAVMTFGVTIMHRMHQMGSVHHKGDVTAAYWGTYAKPGQEQPKKPTRPRKSHYPTITKAGKLSLPAASSQNTDGICGKVTTKGK